MNKLGRDGLPHICDEQIQFVALVFPDTYREELELRENLVTPAYKLYRPRMFGVLIY